ncbi:MAG TPA: hypothetical protein VI796_04710 [Candidatus Thermoplasmatota archaeon]|nr:hypothetical protein [Candidatus Thermoplasmatota archaeon]
MKTPLLASLVIAALLGTTAVAGVTLVAFRDGGSLLGAGAGADEHALHGGHAGDGAHAQVGMQRPHFPEASGSVPSAEDAKSLEEVSFLDVETDRGFAPANGVRSGSGTMEDPFVISGYYVTGDLYLGDTDGCVEITGNYVAGQLSLNWNGQCVWVHHNYIRDLRVNENIPRDGYATGGLLELNKITFIGQLRHYDGEFRNNVVGPFTPSDVFDTVLETTPLIGPEVLVANVDGFNQGLIHHNTFYGSVNLDLHGHHHGTGFFAPHSHYHGANMTKLANHEEDHTDRWTSVAFTDNKIVDEKGYGLLYDDQNHAGDDRQANSEDLEVLTGAHVHHVLVEISRNTVEGAGIWIDIFGADDEYHLERNLGTLTLADNQVTVKERDDSGLLGETPLFWANYRPNAGICLWAGKEAQVEIRGNTLAFVAAPERDDPTDVLGGLAPFLFYPEIEPAAIVLDYVRDANITIADNTAGGFQYGVYAQQMDEKVFWSVEGNDFGAIPNPVWYDESVANRPGGEASGDEDEGHPHDHPNLRA